MKKTYEMKNTENILNDNEILELEATAEFNKKIKNLYGEEKF